MGSTLERIFVDGAWRESHAIDSYRAVDPTNAEAFGASFPVSAWTDVNSALTAASGVASIGESERAALLRAYADAIEASNEDLAATARRETALPARERFADVEIPRTVDQLRQAAACVDRRDWQLPTIDTRRDIRSCLDAIGPVATFGPANFPFAYNAIAGGDFASAIAAGCPVIGRAHPSHPNTTKRLMDLLVESSTRLGAACPAQLLFGFSNDDGLQLAGDRRLGAIGFTGSRGGGIALKAEADASDVAFFGELSGINPVVITTAALEERGDAIADEYVASVLLAGGQMCTKPGLVVLVYSRAAQRLMDRVGDAFRTRPPATLLNAAIADSLKVGVRTLIDAGARAIAGGHPLAGVSIGSANTALVVEWPGFLRRAALFQRELFGNACLFVVCGDERSRRRVLGMLESNLTASIYAEPGEFGSESIRRVFAMLRPSVGRLLTNAMPTGVAVSPAMNHGGPWPASTSPHFSAVGFPGAVRRFAKLDCYDRVHPALLPDVLRDENPTGAVRLVDGVWTDRPIGTT